MDIKKDFFSDNKFTRDLFEAMCGDQLGAGATRSVYRYKFNEEWVVKFEHGDKWFCNQSEWDLWQYVREERNGLAKWFARCSDISPGGLMLFQKFIPDIPEEKLPKRVPECFVDLKRENWGIWRGQPVCRDYGNHDA